MNETVGTVVEQVTEQVAETPKAAKATRAPRKPKAATPAKIVGVVGALPVGFAELREALATVNASTSMKVDDIRKDVRAVTRIMEAAGKRAMPPAGRGRWSGLRTYDFQNTLYAANDREDWRFSDRTLCVAWAVELPSNKCDYPEHADYVASTRTDYLKGRHGSNVVDPAHKTSHKWEVTK